MPYEKMNDQDISDAVGLARQINAVPPKMRGQSVSAAPTSMSEDLGRIIGQTVAAAPEWLRAGSDPNKIESAVTFGAQMLPPLAAEQALTDVERGNYGSAAANTVGLLPLGKMAAPAIVKAMAMMPAKKPANLGSFLDLASTGKIHQAKTPKEDLKSILAKDVPATSFDIRNDHPLSYDYETGKLTEKLRKSGLYVEDNGMGSIRAGTTPEALDLIKNAETPLEFGKAYGYSDSDIANFYLKRRGGNAELANEDYVNDLSKFNEKHNSAPAVVGNANPGEEVLRLRAQEMELPRAQRTQPSGYQVFETTPTAYKRTEGIVPQQSFMDRLPRPIVGKALPLNERMLPILDIADEVAAQYASKMAPYQGKNVEYFYHTGPVYEKSFDLLGDEGAGRAFMDRFSKTYAGTSPRTPTEQNLLNSSLLSYRVAEGLPIEKPVLNITGNNDVGYPMISGMHPDLTRRLLAGEDTFANNPKPSSFAENVRGNLQGVTADTHNIRGILRSYEDLRPGSLPREWFKTDADYDQYLRGGLTPDILSGGINDSLASQTVNKISRQSEYGPMADITARSAEILGEAPAPTQSLGWFGLGDLTNLRSAPKTLTELMGERIDVTAQKLGIDPEETARLYMQGKIPLMNQGGRVGDDADIEAAVHTARQNFEGGGVAINQDQIDEGIIAANQSLQELRGAKQAVRDEAASNQSWGDWASQMGQNLYGMKDIGLFHDIVPGTIEAAKQAATMPYRQQMAAASGQPWNEQQQIGEAFNTAGMFTLGAGAIPAEANALRAGAGMYSKAERAALGLPMEKMQGPQALAMLGKAGIGPEELQWTGLADRLPQTSQLTKQQLVDMIRQNDVNLDEVNLGFTPIAQRHDELLNKKLNDTLTEAEEKEYQELAHSVDLGYGQNEPKYMQYALPGGKNYQETLVTLDANKTFRNYTDKLFNEYVADVAKNFTDEGASSDRAISLATKMANALAEKVEWATMARALGKEDEYMDVFNKTPDNFQSKHWSEQNVLAHIRTNQFDGFENGKYFTPASEKVFNLDELQSDWAQKGRQDGFTDRSQDWPDQYNDFRKKMVEEWVAKKAKTAFDENPELFNNNFDQAAEIAYQVAKQKGASKIAEDLGMSAEHTQLYNKANSYYNSVPLAPYVQSTNQWADLGLKKAVSQAIDSGSDVFTWTPGKVSADRYDLSRQVRKIHFLQNDDGTFHVGTELPDGTEFNQASGVMDLEKIEKTFGKEIAKKVKNGEFTGADNNVSYIEGKDLAVGGKGMIDFYDNIVPKRLSEIIRKATGEKPQFQTWTIQTADGPMEVQGLRLTPEMKAKLQAIKEKEGGYFPHMAYGGKVDDNSVNKALRIAAEASV